MATKIYGASDDLIEFEGDVRGEVGFYGSSHEEKALIAFNDGTVLAWWYAEDGVWRCDVLNKGSLYDRFEKGISEDSDPYSDVVHLKDGAKRAWFGKNAAIVS